MNRYWWKVLWMIIFIVAAALLPAGASATPVVPDPFYGSFIRLIHTGVGQEVDSNAPGTIAFGGASMTVTGVPVPLVSGQTVGSDAGSLEASGRLLYYYAAVGPVDDIIVPLFVTFTLHVSGGIVPGMSTSGANATINVDGLTSVAEQIHTIQIPACDVGLCEMSISDTLRFTQLANHVASVDLQAFMGSSGAGTVADAFADPFIFIDPVFLASNPGYSVIVSAGIGNAAPAVDGVPEPATVLLLGTGLLGLLGYGWRRRYGSAAPSTGSSS